MTDADFEQLADNTGIPPDVLRGVYNTLILHMRPDAAEVTLRTAAGRANVIQWINILTFPELAELQKMVTDRMSELFNMEQEAGVIRQLDDVKNCLISVNNVSKN